MVKNMNTNEINLQLALQCAPVITGIKISNLLIIPKANESVLEEALSGTELEYVRILKTKKNVTYLIFHKDELEEYLNRDDIKEFLENLGYADFTLSSVMAVFQKRYRKYMNKYEDFPHEMGILLGYPIEDVNGFIDNDGKNFLYSGYWKVYEGLNEKIDLFEKYDKALHELVYFVSEGLEIKDLICMYSETKKSVSTYKSNKNNFRIYRKDERNEDNQSSLLVAVR